MNFLRISMNGCFFSKELETIEDLQKFFKEEGYTYVQLVVFEQYDDLVVYKKLKVDDMAQEDFDWALGCSNIGHRYLKGQKN